VEYSLRIVATNLAIVETNEPEGAIKLPVGDLNDVAKAPLLEDYDGEMGDRAGQGKPITSSIRATFRHLHSIGGFRSRWRGLAMGIFYSITYSLLEVVFSAMFSFMPILGFVIARLGAAAMTCNIHAAWIHAVIATPTDKPFFQRFLPRKTAYHLVLPAMRLQVGVMAMQAATFGTLALSRHIMESHGANWLTATSVLMPIVASLAIGLGHVIPSQIALTRAEASLLPEDRSVVVPFDRTFGGRINWDGFASRKAYFLHNFTLRGAYRSFDKPTYKRVFKMMAKCFAVLMAITFVFAQIGLAEFYAIAGKEAKEAFRYVQSQRA